MSTREAPRSGWSFQLATALGIPIRIHFTFLLLLAWFGFVSARAGDSLLLALLFLLSVFACVVLHELGHASMATRFGVRTREIVLYPIGGIARLESIPEGRAELLIALAGPAVNLLLALFLLGAVLAVPLLAAEAQRLTEGPAPLVSAAQLPLRLLLVNLVLALFNLLPAFPMDGGRVLRASLALATSQERATEISAAVGQGVSILFGVAGILLQNFLLMFIALFVFIGASQEALFYRQRALVRGRTVREAMITRFETLAPQDSLEQAAEHLLATHQQDFPVLDGWKRVVGVLPRERLLQGLARLDRATPVMEVMQREVPTVSPADELEAVLQRLRALPQCPVLVLEEGRLLGMVTLENLTEFMEISRHAGSAGAS